MARKNWSTDTVDSICARPERHQLQSGVPQNQLPPHNSIAFGRESERKALTFLALFLHFF